MNEKELDKAIEEIIDIIFSHQDDLSDGFEYYGGTDTWASIRKEVRKALQNMEKQKK